MKSAWSYFLNLILIVIIVLIFLGIIPIHKHEKTADGGQSSATLPPDIVAYLGITDKGDVRPLKRDGSGMGQCGIKPDSPNKHCKGLGGNPEVVQSSHMFNIMTAKGSTCILIIGAAGLAYQLCY